MGWWIALGGAFIAIGFGLHRLALWADGRGWIYYQTKPKFKGSSLGLIEGIYNPAVEHLVEEQSAESARRADDESGDKLGDGSGGSDPEPDSD